MFRKIALLLSMVMFGAVIGAASAHETLTREQRAEIRFMQGMIDHHQMALDMAVHCLENAATDAVQAICQDVIDAQTPEIEQMQGWLLEWYNIDYAPVSMLQPSDEHEHEQHSDNPMLPDTDMPMTMGMMAGLNRYEGVDYDIAWVEAMIDHHDDAVHMSERMLTRFVHTELGELAQAIIDAQTAEIVMMEALLPELEAEHAE